MNIQSENNLDEPLNSQYPDEHELQGLRDHPPPAKLQHHEFKALIFMEFLCYFLAQAILGPLAYFLIFRWLQGGKILSRNLHVFGGKSEIYRTALWAMKVYCYATTFTFVPNFNSYEYDSMSQFWLLLYTDMSLVVLSSAFYSSFSDKEIKRFRTEVFDSGDNTFKRLIAMIKYANTKVLDRTSLSTAFPEIDQANFYFVFPKSDESMIPRDLAPESLQDAAPQFEGLGITNGIVVRGEKVASHIIEVAGYKNFHVKISVLKFVSRLLILIRITLPVVSNVYLILTKANPFDGNHLGSFVIYLIQQGFYSYLIYRFVTVYDVIFLGLFLYKKKYNMLKRMGDIIAFKVKPNKPTQLDLHICGSVPQNAHAWLNVRRILSSINEQVFLVVDTNMSFVLLYTFLFLALFFLQTMDLLTGLLDPARKFLEAKPSLLILLALTVFVVIIVLVVDVVIGIFINDLFAIERGQWLLHKQAAGNIEIKHEMYLDPGYQKLADKRDTRLRKLNEIQELLGDNFSEQLYVYLRRLKNSIMLAIDGITGEENYNPHCLFGIPTNTTSVVAISTLASALGLTTIAQVFDILRSKAQLD